jgi:hypothetical protein
MAEPSDEAILSKSYGKAWLYVMHPTVCCVVLLETEVLLLRCDKHKAMARPGFLRLSFSTVFTQTSVCTDNLMVAIRVSTPFASDIFSIVLCCWFTYMWHVTGSPYAT